MPPSEHRPFIRVHNGMPEHPKVVPLSDGAFRTLIKLWCYCDRNETDGRVPAGIAATMRRAHLNELEKAGLLESRGGDWYCHDYLEWQRSAAEIATALSVAGKSGAFGAHKRWHVLRNIKAPDCPFCYPDR